MPSPLRRAAQVGEEKTITLDHVTYDRVKWFAKHRSGEDTGMKFTMFTARVDALGQFVEKRVVERPPGKRSGKLLRIYARDHRDDTRVNHAACE